MRIRLLLLTAFAAWVAGAAHAWPTIPPRGDTARPAPPVPTIDQLIERLAEVRAQEAELQARRAELEHQVRDRLAEQTRRLQQVGVSPVAIAVPIPPPPLPGMDLGVPPDAAPPPATRRTFTPWSGEIETIAYREREPGWTEPGALADRFDALGGLPLAYTRWRNTGVRWGPESVPSSGFSTHTGY